ncbi:MAG: transposase [Pseudonocardiaceae bacterium]
MVTLTTATEAANHRAPEAVRINHTLHTLDLAREAIASRVTGGEIVPLASRATWLATGSGGAGTVALLGLQQFGTPCAVDRRPSRRRWRGERDGRPGPCWPERGNQWWPAPLVVAGEPAPAPATHNATIPPERIQHTRLTESPRAVLAGDRDSTGTSVVVDRWCLKARRNRILEFVKTARTIPRHRDGIDAAIDRGLSNGRQEGLHNEALLITRRAYDFHSPEAAPATVIHTCRPVNLKLSYRNSATHM